MLDDAANVVERGLGKTAVLVPGEQVRPILGKGLVNMHAGPVVTDHRLGHEGCGLTIGVGDIPNRILLDLRSSPPA